MPVQQRKARAHLDLGASLLHVCALCNFYDHMAIGLGQHADQQIDPVHLRHLHTSKQLVSKVISKKAILFW
jgi:hypothetical protein